jgi:hypothetical protein
LEIHAFSPVRRKPSPSRSELRPALVDVREAAEPLDRERRLGLGAVPRQALADQAEVHRRRRLAEQPLE